MPRQKSEPTLESWSRGIEVWLEIKELRDLDPVNYDDDYDGWVVTTCLVMKQGKRRFRKFIIDKL
jgi:hypothetical protein